MRKAGKANISHRRLRSSSILRQFAIIQKLQRLYPQVSEDVESKFQTPTANAATVPPGSLTIKTALLPEDSPPNSEGVRGSYNGRRFLGSPPAMHQPGGMKVAIADALMEGVLAKSIAVDLLSLCIVVASGRAPLLWEHSARSSFL
jgi:hypothetical protein